MRLLVPLYIKLAGLPRNYSDLIRLDDAFFTDAVQKYEHAMTHHIASKMELWMEIFVKQVFGVTNSNVAMEFSKSRGDISFHSTNNYKSELQ